MSYNLQEDIKILKKFAQKNKNLKITLLCGPKSYEDALYFDQLPFSKISSGFIFEGLKKLGFKVRVTRNTLKNLEQELDWADVVFVNMHGEFGEDGAVQGFLSYINKPFTGSGIYTNALTIDKVIFKDFVLRLGYSTPKHFVYSDFKKVDKESFPLVLKLRNGGSSIGMYKVDSFDKYKSILEGSLQNAKNYFAEQFIQGKDLTVSIIDLPTQTIILPLLEIKTTFYDKETKIKSQKGEHVADYIVPASIDDSITKKISKDVLDIYKQTYCNGFARIDLILEKNDHFQVLELNTIPGLQKDSNFLICASAAGLSIDIVLLALIYKALNV